MAKDKPNRFIGRIDLTGQSQEPEPEATSPPSPEPDIQSEARRKVGRPRGKRSDTRYQSVTTFLRADTYQAVQKALIGTGQDFGDVVDDLLAEWLRRRS